MIKSKHRKHSSFKKINKSKRHIMKGGSPTDRMLANMLTILELQFPETYKIAASDSRRWFDWKKHLYHGYL
jgi:hypothetical protein